MARWRWILIFLLCLGVVFTACGDDTITDGGVPCTRNEECGVGEYCNNGFCTPYKTCTTDEDCAAGEICSLGVCEPGTRPDGGDGDADGGDQLPDGGDPAADEPQPQPEITLAGDVIEIVDQQGTTYEINYGSVTMGTPVTRVLIIRNTGDADLEVSVINIDMDPNGEFRLEPTVPPALTIEPGGEEPLGVIYTPADGLTDRAIAEIFSNDPVNGQIPVQLISEFKGTAEIGLIPSTLDFGNVPVGQTPMQSFEIVNNGTGNAVLRINDVAPDVNIAHGYSVVLVDPISGDPVTPPHYLNNGELIRADVTFTTPSRGSYDGVINVTSDDPASPTASVTVLGRAGVPVIAVDPLSINFGQVPANALPVEQQVTIRNDGAGDLNISSIALTGASTDMTLLGLPDPIPPLAPANNLVVTVQYLPTDVGTDDQTVTIQSDDPAQATVLVSVTGEGIQGNADPTAVIYANGQDLATIDVMLNDQVALDGTHSFDTDGTVDAYEWRIVSQPAIHPCGQESDLDGAMLDVTSIRLREAGKTTIGLRVQDDLLAWSTEDLLEINVDAKPRADVRVGGNTTGYIEVDMGDTITFDGTFSSDCDGIVNGYAWSWGLVPPGRGGDPTIGGGNDYGSVLFDFPGMYVIQLVVTDNDGNPSDPAEFDILVKGPKAFRITADWFDQGNDDHHVDVDIHLLKPGSTAMCSADDCYPAKQGGNHPTCDDSGNMSPNWGQYGSPTYQSDSWEDVDGLDDPLRPADVVNFLNPGMGVYGIYVTFRCHSSGQFGGDYLCCDDMCTIGCPFCVPCAVPEDKCGRRAVGTAHVYVTDYYDNETLEATVGFSFDSEEHYQYRQLGTLSWPDGTFQ